MEKIVRLNQKKQSNSVSKKAYATLSWHPNVKKERKKNPYDHLRTWTTSKTVQMIFVLWLIKFKTVITLLSVHKTSHVKNTKKTKSWHLAPSPRGWYQKPVSLFLSHAFIERM